MVSKVDAFGLAGGCHRIQGFNVLQKSIYVCISVDVRMIEYIIQSVLSNEVIVIRAA